MRTITLNNLPCLGKKGQLQKLNELLKISDSLMPHQVAIATGCGMDDALALLLLMLRLSVVEGFLLVYHNAHLDGNPPIMARSIFVGLPELPFSCDVCGREIVNANEVSYDFLFKLKEEIQFAE